MKKRTFLAILLVVGIVFNSCDESDFEYEESFKKSHEAWIDFKTETNNYYTYTTLGSTWAGASWETTITVSDGKVVQRSFKYTHIAEDITVPVELEWTENEEEINTHESTPASEALTLDAIYEKAKQDWLVKRKNASTFFETKNNGLISLCGYIFDGCQDDCFIGIEIVKIEALYYD